MNKLMVFSLAAIFFVSCNSAVKMENELKAFIDTLEVKVKPVESGAALAYFNAAVTGQDEEYAKSSELNIQLSKIYADKAAFAKLKEFKESGKILLLKQQKESKREKGRLNNFFIFQFNLIIVIDCRPF